MYITETPHEKAELYDARQLLCNIRFKILSGGKQGTHFFAPCSYPGKSLPFLTKASKFIQDLHQFNSIILRHAAKFL